MQTNKLLSIIIPMFNEQDNITPLYQELLEIFKKLKYFNSYEIIAVNDGSQDNTLLELKKLSNQDKHFKILSFTRNFGHEAATHAGIYNTSGEAIVLIDADRQDPPELILQFEQEYLSGYQIVFGQRTKRIKESFFKKFTSKIFYPIFKKLTKVDLPPNTGDFCLLSRKAVDYFKKLPEKTLFIRGLIYWSGLPKKAIPFIRRARGAGTTKYNYYKLTIFALENIISFSIIPIYFIIFISLLTIMGCITGTIIAIILKISGKVILTGWTSLIICILFCSASILFTLGILGLYIGKIFQEVKNRPIYLIDEKINF